MKCVIRSNDHQLIKGYRDIYSSLLESIIYIKDILLHYKTKRRDLFYTCDMSESIGREYRILRVGHDDRYGDRAFQYVNELINELISDGRLRTGNTKYGRGIRTALQSELRPIRSHRERQVSA